MSTRRLCPICIHYFGYGCPAHYEDNRWDRRHEEIIPGPEVDAWKANKDRWEKAYQVRSRRIRKLRAGNLRSVPQSVRNTLRGEKP